MGASASDAAERKAIASPLNVRCGYGPLLGCETNARQNFKVAQPHKENKTVKVQELREKRAVLAAQALEVASTDAEKFEKIMKDVLSTPPAVISRVKDYLGLT